MPSCYRPDVFRRFIEEAFASGGALTVVRRADGEVIGSSRFHGYDETRGEIEIGRTFLSRQCWGGAYNGEMKRLMIGHALRYVSNIVFLVGAENRRSQRALEKIGAVHAGCRSGADGRLNVVYLVTAARTRSRDSASLPLN